MEILFLYIAFVVLYLPNFSEVEKNYDVYKLWKKN